MVSNKWVVIALTASLAVNVFLAGLFVGRQMAGPPPPLARFVMRERERPTPWRPGDPDLPPFIKRIADAMAPQYRAILIQAMDQHRADLTAAGLAFRDARMKMRQILMANDFDRPAAEAAMAELRDKETAFHAALQSALLDAAAQLPVQGRRQLVSPPPPGPPPPK
jgi:uncharacterized membrane protein